MIHTVRGRTFHTEEAVWAEGRVEIQQLTYACVCVRTGMCLCPCRCQSEELALER